MRLYCVRNLLLVGALVLPAVATSFPAHASVVTGVDTQGGGTASAANAAFLFSPSGATPFAPVARTQSENGNGAGPGWGMPAGNPWSSPFPSCGADMSGASNRGGAGACCGGHGQSSHGHDSGHSNGANAGNCSPTSGWVNGNEPATNNGPINTGENLGGTPIVPVAPVPVPASVWFILAALGTLLTLRRRSSMGGQTA